ncbi:MAG: phage/plasmid primase, P4 family, partial [Alphaproteobacteria bacterium]
TGFVSEQKLVFFHGIGANGKSTLLNIMARILGGYAMSLPFASLIQDDFKRGSEPSPDLARLPAVRMVRASEAEKGSRFSEATIKMMTGGEEMTVRHLNRDFFDFAPVFKLVLSGNHRPTIRGQDHGIWRRLMLVPFLVTITKPDKRLDDDLWAERAGILNWMLDGTRMWLETGLDPPPEVCQATDEYRSDSDRLGQFLNSWTVSTDGVRVQARALYDAYVLWCAENADEPVSMTLFGRMLVERGLAKEKVGVMFYVGLELTDEAAAALSRKKSRGKEPDE